MRKILSALLATVMLWAVLPQTAFFSNAMTEQIIAIPIVGVPQPDAAFVIYAPSVSRTMGPEASNGKTAAPEALSNENNSSLGISAGTGLYKLKAADVAGAFYLTCGGRYYTAISTSRATFCDAPAQKGSVWKIEELGSGYRIANTDFFYNHTNPACIESYAGYFSTAPYASYDLDRFLVSFYSVDEAAVDADGDGCIEMDLTGQPLPVGNEKIDILTEDAFVGLDYSFSFALKDLSRITDVKAEYDVGSGFQAIALKEVESNTYEAAISKDILAGKTELIIRVTIKNEYETEYFNTVTVMLHNEPLIVSVSPLPDTAIEQENRPKISAQIVNCGTNPQIVMTVDGTAINPTVTGSEISYDPTSELADGSHIVVLTVTRDDGRKAERIWSFEIREQKELTDCSRVGHAIVKDEAMDATCTESGLTEGSHCSRCDEIIVKQEIIPPLGHDVVADEAVSATCTKSGLTEGSHCSRCNVVIVKQEVAAELGHSYVNGICVRCGMADPEDTPVQSDMPCDGGRNCPSYRFADVNYGDWFHEAVDFAITNGLFNGMGDNKFAPNTAMNRAMLVTVLWRYAGSPEEGINHFSDVKDGQWYTDAIAWASSNGIVGGVGNGKFNPNGNVTREQMAAILYRYCEDEGISTGKSDNLSAFPDKAKVSSWAADALKWAVGEGLINGNSGKLDPQGKATRAQVATILMRFIQNVAD